MELASSDDGDAENALDYKTLYKAGRARERKAARRAAKDKRVAREHHKEVEQAACSVASFSDLRHDGDILLLVSLETIGKITEVAADHDKNDRSLKPQWCKTLVCRSFWKGQRAKIGDAVLFGRGNNKQFFGLKRSFEGASHFMTVKSEARWKEVCQRLGVSLDCLRPLKKKKHRYVMQIMQQRCFLKTPKMQKATPVFILAKVMAIQTGESVFNTVDNSVPELISESTRPAVANSEAALLVSVTDSCKANKAQPSKLAYDHGNAFIEAGRCDQHMGNICVSSGPNVAIYTCY